MQLIVDGCFADGVHAKSIPSATPTYNAASFSHTMPQTAPPSSNRIIVAALLFISCCLLSSVRILEKARAPNPLHADDIEKRSDQRFALLKAALPQNGVVGYVGDSDNLEDYYLAQYALAPVVVDRSPNHPLVVGNFPTAPAPADSNLQLLKDFGNGVLLFANKDRK
jgi:hypothetical protein